jgi:hypothetical protein
MLKFIVVVAGLLYSAASLAYSEKDLLGTWKLVSGSRKDVNTGEVTVAFGGPRPVGFISYGIRSSNDDSGRLRQSDQTGARGSGDSTAAGSAFRHDVRLCRNVHGLGKYGPTSHRSVLE